MPPSSWPYLLLGLSSGAALALLGPFTVKRVEGHSMSPTLNPPSKEQARPPSEDILLVRRLRAGGPTQEEADQLVGQVVCLKSPRRPGTTLVKRLAATAARGRAPGGAEVPEGRCWVSSDAGAGRYADSGLFGPVPAASLTGVARLVLWPPERAGTRVSSGER